MANVVYFRYGGAKQPRQKLKIRVAPKARLMPIRLASGLGSQAEADAFEWAADHGADVISCRWRAVRFASSTSCIFRAGVIRR